MTLGPTSETSDPADLAYAIIVATRPADGQTEFLMVRHKERGWELPGGKVEDTEGPVHAALREFREETGHLLSEPKFVLKLKKENGTCFVFKGHMGAKVQPVHAEEAIRDMQWCRELPPVDQLAFPDDPYEEMGELLGLKFRPSVQSA